MANETKLASGLDQKAIVIPEIKIPPTVAEAIAKGRVVFYGEFRRGIAVEFSGKGNRVFHQSKCSIETDTGTITVTEFLQDGVDWTKWVPPFPKGTMVMCVCRSLEESSGVQVASGRLEAI